MAQSSSASCATPVPIISDRYCAPHAMDLVMVRMEMALADGNFVVTDINGNMIFQAREMPFGYRQQKRIVDAAGNVIVTLRRKAMTAHWRWKVFTGESTDSKDLLFSAKTNSCILQKANKLNVYLANNKKEMVCDFQVKGSFFEWSCVVYAGNEDSNAIVAQMHLKHRDQSMTFMGRDSCMVTVNPNIDYAFIVALIVILYDNNSQLRDLRENEKRSD